MMLPLPPLLEWFIEAHRWPANEDEARRQNLKSLVPPERVKRIAPEENAIFLYPPPFCTVRQRSEMGEENFWTHPHAAATEIDFDLSLDIGDFGLGSDAPILLDYREKMSNPRVIRLRWPRDGTAENHWVLAALDFEAFVAALGL